MPFFGRLRGVGRVGNTNAASRVDRGRMASNDNHHDDDNDNPNGLFFLTAVFLAKVSSHVCYIQLQIFFFERHT